MPPRKKPTAFDTLTKALTDARSAAYDIERHALDVDKGRLVDAYKALGARLAAFDDQIHDVVAELVGDLDALRLAVEGD